MRERKEKLKNNTRKAVLRWRKTYQSAKNSYQSVCVLIAERLLLKEKKIKNKNFSN